MQIRHMPNVGARYWAAISMASLFGTNLGDLYAHDSGLGLIGGVPILAALAAVVFLVERFDRVPREAYCWLVILIIRTGATNIADYTKHQIPYAVFGGILTILLIGFAFASPASRNRQEQMAEEKAGMPKTGIAYWCAMLTAGVFGTFFGDVAQHLIGQAPAALILALLLLATLAFWHVRGASLTWPYWLVVAVAHTAGTAMGDWLAENDLLSFGLPLATAISGVIFVAILLFWPRQPKQGLATAL
jgi:uncharacterized membrane-anchored protein